MVIADTGFWVALANRRDRHHDRARAALLALDEPLVTTWPVLTETSYLLLDRGGPGAAAAFLDSYSRAAFEVWEVRQEKAARAADLLRRYSDLPMDLADASLVLLAEDLGHGRILTSDRRDFGIYRWRQSEPFENLLLPS